MNDTLLRIQAKNHYRAFWLLTICLLFANIFCSCNSFGPVEPNKIYTGPFPVFFNYMEQQNTLLAREIGKLPELQNGIQEKDALALKLLCDIHKKKPGQFNHMFDEIYAIGLPDVRRYCTPLQALFWMAQKGEIDKINSLLTHYSLEKLLSLAWDFNPPVLSDADITLIVDGIKDEALKRQYRKDRTVTSNEKIQNFFLIDYRRNKKAFSKPAGAMIKTIRSFRHPRWADLDEVVERLNSPELVNYFEHARIKWVDWRTLPTWPVSSGYVFRYGNGDCTAIADFTALCLKRAGYKAYEYKVPPTRSVDNHHSICVFYVNEKKYVMDNGRPLQRGIMLFDEY